MMTGAGLRIAGGRTKSVVEISGGPKGQTVIDEASQLRPSRSCFLDSVRWRSRRPQEGFDHSGYGIP